MMKNEPSSKKDDDLFGKKDDDIFGKKDIITPVGEKKLGIFAKNDDNNAFSLNDKPKEEKFSLAPDNNTVGGIGGKPRKMNITKVDPKEKQLDLAKKAETGGGGFFGDLEDI